MLKERQIKHKIQALHTAYTWGHAHLNVKRATNKTQDTSTTYCLYQYLLLLLNDTQKKDLIIVPALTMSV